MRANTRFFQEYSFVISADVKHFANALAVQAAAPYPCLCGLVLNHDMGPETRLPCAPYQYTCHWAAGGNSSVSSPFSCAI